MTGKKTVHLFHWNEAEIKERISRVRDAGYEATGDWAASPAAISRVRDAHPDAIVIDLSRLPSHGREIALTIRQYKGMRAVPIVFVDGDPEKIAAIKSLMPDSAYTTWSRIRSSLKAAIAHPPDPAAAPCPPFDAYSGRPLAKKLGILFGFTVSLIGAPKLFEEGIAGLPADVSFRRRAGGACDLTLWFIRGRQDLDRDLARVLVGAGVRGLWIIWPKKGSGIATDVSQVEVRSAGLAAGWVDYKVCAVDSVWTGLKFSRRR
jgi:CheY-like chemotaxis protein